MRPTGLRRDELQDGYARLVEFDDAKVLLIRLGDEVRAVSAWCTHMRTLIGGQPVDEDGLVECPMHGAVFDSTDGSLQLGPACDPLPVFEVGIGADGAVGVHVVADPAVPSAARRPSSFGAWGASGT